tara:strand:+ start:348 stop:2168 length:1821 start_codon:yes stop_codon:yes gene_type:complete
MANETVTVTQSVNNVHVVTSGATGLNAGGDIDGNLSITPIWNESGTEFTSLLVNVTDTSSSSTSELLDMQVGGVSKFAVDKAGDTVATGGFTVGGELQIERETPYITLKNSTAENTDGGCESKIIFEDHTAADLALIEASHSGTSDDTKGKLIFSANNGSTLIPTLTLTPNHAHLSGTLDVDDDTDATDATGETGALRTEGGASIALKLYVGSDIVVGGTVDGRDVAADGTKLDGIEPSADVTDATNVAAAGALMDSELTDLAGVKGVTISTLQAKPSEGAFEDGDKTKLDAIDVSADVTDATTVAAAGALMDSELTDLAGVKSLDCTTLQVKPSEGAFADGDKTKLDAIEDNADVTDATNVSAAGALMKSGGTMTGAITFGSGVDANYNTISNLSDGSSAQDAVTKTQLDSVSSSLDSHTGDTSNPHSVTASDVSAVPLSGGVTINGTITMGDTLDLGSNYLYYGLWYGGQLSGNLNANSAKITNLAEGTANGDSLRWEQLRTIKNDQTGTTYTLVVGDATKTVRLNNASTVTVTVPDNTFEPGDVITLFRKGAGGVTIEEASGVTINSVGDKKKLAYQYSAATLICITKGSGASEFDLIGDLTT